MTYIPVALRDPQHVDPKPGRLNEYDREEIRAAARAGISIDQLCKEYNRKPLTIRKTLRRTD